MDDVSLESVDSNLPSWTQSSEMAISSSPEQDPLIIHIIRNKLQYFSQWVNDNEFILKIWIFTVTTRPWPQFGAQDIEHDKGRLEKAARCVQLAWKKLVSVLGVQTIQDMESNVDCTLKYEHRRFSTHISHGSVSVVTAWLSYSILSSFVQTEPIVLKLCEWLQSKLYCEDALSVCCSKLKLIILNKCSSEFQWRYCRDDSQSVLI